MSCLRPYYPPPSYGASQYITDHAGSVSPADRNYGYFPSFDVRSTSLIPAGWLYRGSKIPAAMTPQVKGFLLLSGMLYIFWSLSIISIEIATIIDSRWTFYRAIWTGGFLLILAISLLFIASRPSYLIWQLTQFFIFGSLICVIGLLLSAISFSRSLRCVDNPGRYQCDTSTVFFLKMAILILVGLATIHTAINLAITMRFQTKSQLSPSIATVSGP